MVPRRTLWKGLFAAGLVVSAFAGIAVWRLSAVTSAPADLKSTSLFDFSVPDLDGHPVSLSAYRGQVVLVVNVASECGLAVQYPGLDTLYRRYKDRGFVILAFPSNDFWQEPNADADIQTVCNARGVTFPVFAKSHVRGSQRSPVYDFLSTTGETPLWNFAKYVVGRDGRPRGFFGSLVAPDSPALTGAIERVLAEAVTVPDGR
jgi:glutathione peroxidase